MGICKCRKKTEWFCYDCEKAVCYDCVTDEIHNLAKVTPYAEWLENNASPPPCCALSGKPITSNDEVVRFTDMKLYLLSAIDEYGKSKPNLTALAGFTIPGSNEPMVPPITDQSKLAKQIREKLCRFSWITDLIQMQKESMNEIVSPTNTKKYESKTLFDGGSEGQQDTKFRQLENGYLSASTKAVGPTSPALPGSGIAARKTATAPSCDVAIDVNLPTRDDDADQKYGPKPISKVFEALGFISSIPSNNNGKVREYRLKGRGVVVVFVALVVTFGMVFFLATVMSNSPLDDVKPVVGIASDKIIDA